MEWSSASSPCRIEWRPSRLGAGCALLLGVLAAASVWLSDAPLPVRAVGVPLLPGWGLIVALRWLRRPDALLVWAGGQADAVLLEATGSQTLHGPALGRRGAWLWLDYRDPGGRRRRLLWWPDTLNAAQRRALVVAAQRRIGGDSLLPLVAG